MKNIYLVTEILNETISQHVSFKKKESCSDNFEQFSQKIAKEDAILFYNINHGNMVDIDVSINIFPEKKWELYNEWARLCYESGMPLEEFNKTFNHLKND